MSSVDHGEMDAAALSGVDLAFGFVQAAYTPQETAAITDFLNGGGRLVLVGEAVGLITVRDSNDAANTLLAALGSGMSFDSTGVDPNTHYATTANGQVIGHPLTAGVDTFRYAFATTVSGGTPLFLTSDLAPFAATEAIGGGIVVIGDQLSPGASDDNDVFHLNLAGLVAVPEPSSGCLVGIALGILLRALPPASRRGLT